MASSISPRRTRPFTGWALGAAVAVSTAAGTAWGYAIEVHKDFYDLAFAGRDAGRSAQPPTMQELEQLRRFVWERGSRNQAFLRRWPTVQSFDAAAFKELLGLNPGKRVVGFDEVPAARPTDVRTVVREGSVDPDNDRRNQDRLFVEGGKVVLDPFGRAVPYDPRTVWFGGLTGTPSQFDAHGATLRSGKKGGGVVTAFAHPEQFARPPVPLGSAPEFSQLYAELAMVARLRGGPGGEWLFLTLAGNGMHGIEDLGNQIHTTVLGIPQFFLDAKVTYYQRKLRNMLRKRTDAAAGFGPPSSLTTDQVNAAMAEIKAGRVDQVDPSVRFALGHEPKGVPSDVDLGIQIIGNHHRLLEDFVESQVLEGLANERAGRPVQPAVAGVLAKARAGDAGFERECRDAMAVAGLGRGEKGLSPFVRVLCETMIGKSAPEAAPIYKAIRRISRPGLKREEVYDNELGHKPLDWVTTRSGEDVATIWDLSGKAFARVVTALRLYDEALRAETQDVAPGSPQAVARAAAITDQLIARQLGYLEAAAQRRAEWIKEKQDEKAKADAPKPGMLDRLRGFFR